MTADRQKRYSIFNRSLKIGWLLTAASLCVACASNDGLTRGEGVGRAVPTDLETARTAMDPTDFEVIESFDAGVPDAIPDHAVALAAFVAGQYDGSPGEKPELILASLRPTELNLDLVCVDSARQIPCSALASVWHIGFSDPGAAVVDISGTSAGPPAAVLLSASEDDERVQLASRGFWIAAPGDVAASSGERFRHEPVYGGCGFAVLVNSLAPTETFTPLTSSPRSADLYLLVQTCQDDSASTLVPFVVVNRSRGQVLTSSDSDSGGAIAISPGSAYVIPLTMAEFGEATEIQAFVLLTSQLDGWVTWPVSLSR